MGRGRSKIRVPDYVRIYDNKDIPDDGRRTVKVTGTEHGETKEVEVSIQDISALNGERLTYSDRNAVSQLKKLAMENANNDNIREQYEFTEGKEGTLKKANSIPVIRNVDANLSTSLESHSGYVTKIAGENVYLQKGQGGEYMWNISGELLGTKTYSSVKAAKDSIPTISKEIRDMKANSPGLLDSARGQMIFLNRNKGRVARNLLTSIDREDLARLGESKR